MLEIAFNCNILRLTGTTCIAYRLSSTYYPLSLFFLSGLIAARQGNAYSPSRHKCQTENCEYYGDKKFHGYCSNCYQGNWPDNSQNVLSIHLIILSLCLH